MCAYPLPEKITLNTSKESNTLVSHMQVSVKDVEDQTFREFKAESVREGLKIGKALTLAMKLWLEKGTKKPRVSLLELRPKRWGKGTELTSGEIDKVAYR